MFIYAIHSMSYYIKKISHTGVTGGSRGAMGKTLDGSNRLSRNVCMLHAPSKHFCRSNGWPHDINAHSVAFLCLLLSWWPMKLSMFPDAPFLRSSLAGLLSFFFSSLLSSILQDVMWPVHEGIQSWLSARYDIPTAKAAPAPANANPVIIRRIKSCI